MIVLSIQAQLGKYDQPKTLYCSKSDIRNYSLLACKHFSCLPLMSATKTLKPQLSISHILYVREERLIHKVCHVNSQTDALCRLRLL